MPWDIIGSNEINYVKFKFKNYFKMENNKVKINSRDIWCQDTVEFPYLFVQAVNKVTIF